MTHPQKPVGFLINHKYGLEGNQGLGYDYIMASNGIFVQSQSESITARIQIASASIKGLQEAEAKLVMHHGLIPSELLQQGVEWMCEEPSTERFFTIRWDSNRYVIHIPEQTGTGSSLKYKPPEDAVAEFHSHAKHQAFFSGTDDKDEQAFRIYGVVGRLNQEYPEMIIRVGIYGHFTQKVHLNQIFRGIHFNTVSEEQSHSYIYETDPHQE